MIAQDEEPEEFLSETSLAVYPSSGGVEVKLVELNSSWVFGSFWAKPK